MVPPTSFSYKNEHFTSFVLKLLLGRLEGEWLFTDLGNDQSRIERMYWAIPTNFVALIPIEVALMSAIRSMLTDALTIAKNDLESGQLAGSQFADGLKP